ncbi:hypothetical protein [Massilia phosphatilytica]
MSRPHRVGWSAVTCEPLASSRRYVQGSAPGVAATTAHTFRVASVLTLHIPARPPAAAPRLASRQATHAFKLFRRLTDNATLKSLGPA